MTAASQHAALHAAIEQLADEIVELNHGALRTAWVVGRLRDTLAADARAEGT